jgi:hypothetical protein
VIDPETMAQVSEAVHRCVYDERYLLEEMQNDVRPLKGDTRRILPRSATAISLVGTDGGNNKLQYDPFLVQLVRVVDSNAAEHCLEVVVPDTPLDILDARHLDAQGRGVTPLGRMLEYLQIPGLRDLSPVFGKEAPERSPSWVQVYREMMEWAVVLDFVRNRDFGNDVVIVRDGLLRSKMFAKGLFARYRRGLEDGIITQFERYRRKIFVAGVAKSTKALQKYRLAMAVEGVMRNTYPCYVQVDDTLGRKFYKWEEYVTGGGEGESFVAGRMFLVKFGRSPYAPVWASDLLISQADEASTIFGYLLEDAKDGFPIPHYPQCLQRAHERAALVDFDMDMLQDQIFAALRLALGGKKWLVDELALGEADPASRRYQ